MPAEPHTTGSAADAIVRIASRPAEWMVAASFLSAITTTQKAAGALVVVAVACVTLGMNLDRITERIMGAADVSGENVNRIATVESDLSELRRDFAGHLDGRVPADERMSAQLAEIQADVRNLGDLWCERYPEDCESNPRPRRDP